MCVICLYCHRQTGTVELNRRAEELLYCVYSKLKMGRHDSFAHKALHSSSWIAVFEGKKLYGGK